MSDLYKSAPDSEIVERESIVDLKKNKLKKKLLQHLYNGGNFIAQLTNSYTPVFLLSQHWSKNLSMKSG
jgi:hypothetical protein